MEGFVALGAAINIAQAIEYGFRLIRKSKDLCEREFTDSALKDDAQRLNNLANSLTSQDFSSCSGNLQDLAVKCAHLSKILISELEQLKLTDPLSIVQRAKAIWRRQRKESLIMELERRLQDHKSQFILLLTSISRVESNNKLDNVNLDMQKMSSEIATMHLEVNQLSNSDHIGQAILRTLQPLVQQYHDHFSQSSEQAILDMLHFPDMHERLDTIPDAHKETLHWLFDPAGYDYRARVKAGKDFIAWLRQGSGFFHVSGKPGSGKSTLMKYMCSHQNLNNHLKVWCRGAQLGRGQFFFWKPGSPAQKSLKGLLRGLLYSILEKSRNLIPIAFPDLWKTILARSSSSRQLEYRDFLQGFDNLMTHAGNSGSYKFVLIIDGLDEFEGHHLDLITTMTAWTEKYPLKICVSSREYGVFLQSFSSYPKLRLHECNLMDIEKMASGRLKSNPLCADLLISDEVLQKAVKLIIERAEGVFIWVSIVIAGIEDAIISGADLPELEKRIYAYPEELDTLYWHLVHLIHETDRQWAFRALKIVHFSQCGDSFRVLSRSRRNISLLQLSFLDDIQYDAVAGFPKVSVQRLKTPAQRLDNTYKKVYGRCKGFLTVLESHDDSVPRPMAQRVVFTHRSLVEFLETLSFIEKAKLYVSNFDCLMNTLGTMLRCLEYQQPVPDVFDQTVFDRTDFTDSFIGSFWSEDIESLYWASRMQPDATKMFLHYQEAFRDSMLELSRKVEDQPSIVSWTTQYFALIGLNFGVVEPWKRVRDSFPRFRDGTRLGLFIDKLLFTFLMDNLDLDSNFTQDQCIEVLDCFICFGVGFEFLVRFGNEGLNMWTMIILRFIKGLFPQTWCPGIIINWCLQHGADPDLNIGELIPGGPHSFQWLTPSNEWQLVWISSRKFRVEILSKNSMDEHILITNENSPFYQIIKGNGGVLKLWDLLSYWFPDDEYFPNLIDRLKTSKAKEPSDATFPQTIVGNPPGKIVRRTWETDYKAYELRKFYWALESNGIRAIEHDGRLVFEYSAGYDHLT